MKLRVRLTALAAVVLSTAGVGLTAQSAEAAPIASARVCTSQEQWSFSPPLTLAFTLTGSALQNYQATCLFKVGIGLDPPFIDTSAQAPYSAALGHSYIGGCHVAVFSRGGIPSGIMVGGMVGVFVGTNEPAGSTSNISVKVLTPSPGICNESSATGTGVTVGTF